MIKTIGPDSATFTLYLPNPPSEIPPTMELAQPDIALLTELNGNHWRKIFTILAKLAAPDNNWREYRDQHLLQNAEQISFGDTLKEQRGWQLIAGKTSWQRLGFTDDKDRPHDMLPIDENGRIYIKDQIVLVPYPDYRQFPNQLIELLRERLE